METKKRRCAFCNNAIHEGGSFVAFAPQIKVSINGCHELIRQADFNCHCYPHVFCNWDCFHRFFGAEFIDALPPNPTEWDHVFCNWDCFHRFFGAEFIDALPPNPTEWDEEYYDHKYSMYVEID